MKISGNFRRRSALFMSSTVGLALTLAGCTSVEYSAKGDPSHPKIASAPATPYTATQTANATSTTPDAAAAAGTAAALHTGRRKRHDKHSADRHCSPGWPRRTSPASEIAAAAAIDTQLQPQAATTQVALAAPAAATPATTAVMHQANTAALPQVVALKGSFRQRPAHPARRRQPPFH